MDDESKIPYMDEFSDFLTNTEGLAKKTVKRHLLNAENFIYYMATHGYEADPDCKEEELPMDDALLKRADQFIGMYFSYFLPRKCFSTPGTLRESGGSVKKLYKFLAYKGIVTDEECQEVIDYIKEGIQIWMEEC